MIAGIIIGGVIAIVALVIGHFEGYLMGVKVRNVAALYAQSDNDRNTGKCLCGHTVNTHRNSGGGNCTAFTDVAGGNMPCPCKFFVAAPPEPAGPAGELTI
ncbi:MAG: hypothetical protein ABI345_00615 [Jatrophihabitans sp.]